MMTSKIKKISDIPRMDDDALEKFWENNQPEDFQGWDETPITFKRPSKKLIQLRLDPGDVRIIDLESKKTGIDRAHQQWGKVYRKKLYKVRCSGYPESIQKPKEPKRYFFSKPFFHIIQLPG